MARQQTVELDPYEGLRTRVRWTPSDAARVLADWTQSGESLTAFVRRHRLALHRLHYWRERLETKPLAGEPLGVRFVPAVIGPSPLLAIESRTTVAPVCVIANDVRVEVSDPHSIDPQWVASLVLGLHRART
jgi:transposase-like protein